MNRWIPWIVALISLAWIYPAFKSPRPAADGFDTVAFGKLPVLVGGRIKPIDTVARNSLLIINGKQVVRQESGKLGATRWLMDVLFNWSFADDHWSIFGGIKNLTDELYRVEGQDFRSVSNIQTAYYGDPKMWTVGLEYRY